MKNEFKSMGQDLLALSPTQNDASKITCHEKKIGEK